MFVRLTSEQVDPAVYKAEMLAAYRKKHPEDDGRTAEEVKELFREQYEWRKSIEKTHLTTSSNLHSVLRPGQAEFERFVR